MIETEQRLERASELLAERERHGVDQRQAGKKRWRARRNAGWRYPASSAQRSSM
jgi:hypothetical protein